MTVIDGPIVLSPVLRQALAPFTVDPSGTRAGLPTGSLEADSPAELRSLLAAEIYARLHTGRAGQDADVPFELRDHDLDRRLGAVVPHATTVVTATVCGGASGPTRSADGQYLLLRNGVRTWTPESDVLTSLPLQPGSQIALQVPSAMPAISPGFFLVCGSRPHTPGRHLLRLYVHLADPASAVPVWCSLLEHLEGAGLGYQAKVLSAPALYPRRDAIVVYLPPEHRTITRELAAVLEGAPGLCDETSTFARRIGKGLALAWEPTDPRPAWSGLSFGQHRAAVVARALILSALQGTSREAAMVEHLRQALIDPVEPSRNLDSPR